MQIEQIRAFIAIDLPQEIKSRLLLLENELKQYHSDFIKWVNPDGIHLTLKFLGNTNYNDIKAITGAIKDACNECKSFALETTGIGVFPNYYRPRVIWLGIGGELDILFKAQKRIDDALVKLGFNREKRPFSPHVTLGRVRDNVATNKIREFSEVLKNIKYDEKQYIEVNEVKLIRSQLYSAGAVYTEISSVNLSGFSL